MGGLIDLRCLRTCGESYHVAAVFNNEIVCLTLCACMHVCICVCAHACVYVCVCVGGGAVASLSYTPCRLIPSGH